MASATMARAKLLKEIISRSGLTPRNSAILLVMLERPAPGKSLPMPMTLPWKFSDSFWVMAGKLYQGKPDLKSL